MPRPRPNGNNILPGKPPICPPLGGRLFRRGMRSPRPTSQFDRNLSSRIPILSMCARGAHSVFIIYYLLSFIYYLFCPAGALSSPMVHRSATSREITTKKTALLPPLICTFHSFPRGLSRALKTPHRGVFAPRYSERGARAVLVPDFLLDQFASAFLIRSRSSCGMFSAVMASSAVMCKFCI